MKTAIKPTLFGLGVAAITLGLTGCVISIGGSRVTPPPNPPPAVVVIESADVATVAEIDAAAQLNMDNGRSTALAQIAERSALAVPVQVHLVNVAYRSLSFENNRVHVLTKIIARADFCDATRHAIVSQLSKLSFDNNRQYILQQINERMKATPPH